MMPIVKDYSRASLIADAWRAPIFLSLKSSIS